MAQRRLRLAEQARLGHAAEKVAEIIVDDLLTTVLDWSTADLNHQVGYADILLTKLGVKYLIVETKRPGLLAWNQHAVDAALDQAWKYATEQKVHCVAVSDGMMFYAAEVAHGGLQGRVFARLEDPQPPEDLWWISVHGIYRPRPSDVSIPQLSKPAPEPPVCDRAADASLLHPKYHLPAHCFAYVADASNPATWKLPYLSADGRVDLARLPKAVQAILTNYRGTKVSAIPDPAIPDVLVRLGRAAASIGKMPHQTSPASSAYRQLAEALDQCGRLADAVSVRDGQSETVGPACVRGCT
jgi:hypothetical protein